MSEKEQWINAIRNNSSETIANLILADIERQKEKDKEIERLNNIINEINSIIEYWGYDKEHNDISSFRMAMKNIKDILDRK